MPYVYRFKCYGCGYEDSYSEFATFVLLEDGSEKLCMHPIETSMAEKATGLPMSVLRQNGRIINRRPFACLTCGAVDYYGPHDLNLVTLPRNKLGSIVSQHFRSKIKLYKCRSCNQRTLVTLARYSELPGTMMSMVGGRKYILKCDQCKEGEYTLLLGAIS